MTKAFCAGAGLLLFLVACQKEQRSTIANETNEQKQSLTKEFPACDCQTISEEAAAADYIKAEIDGVPVCFDVKPAMNDTFPNMLKWGYILRDTGKQYYDNLYMIRNARNSQWQAALFFENTYALSKTYPYNLPRPNSEFCEIGELQLNDQAHYTSCSWCPENDYNFYALFFGDGVKMTVTGFNGGIFEGVFSGTVRTGSGRTMQVANGKFSIHLTVFRDDYRVP